MFDSGDGDIVDASLLTFCEKSEVNLSRTQNVSNDFFRLDETFRFRFRDVTLEMGIGTELFDRGTGLRVTEKVFREEDDERLSVITVDLSSEGVEDVGGYGRVDELHVAILMLSEEFFGSRVDERVIVAKLEESFDTSGRVFRSLSIVSMRKGESKTRSLKPFSFARSDELINHDLSSVGKVTDCDTEKYQPLLATSRERRGLTLSFPDNEKSRVDEGVTEFESKDTVFGERRVADGDGGLVLTEVAKGSVGFIGLLVVKDGVTLGESSTLDILTRNTDVSLFEGEGTESEGFSGRVIDVLAVLDGGSTSLQDTLEISVNFESFGSGRDGLSDVLERVKVDTGRTSFEDVLLEFPRRWESIPSRRKPFLRSGLVILTLLERLLK